MHCFWKLFYTTPMSLGIQLYNELGESFMNKNVVNSN